MIKVTLVPDGHRFGALEHVRDFLPNAVAWTLGRYNIDDMVGLLLRPDIQFWLAYDKDLGKGVAFASSQIQQYPQAKVLTILHAAGVQGVLEEATSKLLEVFNQYALDTGCDGLEVYGRAGWNKRLMRDGFEPPHRMYYKKLVREN